MALLNAVRISTSDGLCTIQSTDLDTFLEATAPAEGALSPTWIALSRLMPFVSGESTTIENDGKIRVSAQGRGVFPVMDTKTTDAWPTQPPTGMVLNLDPLLLSHALTTVAHAVSHESTRMNLTGIHVQAVAGVCRVEAADGRRMCIVEFPCEPEVACNFVVQPQSAVLSEVLTKEATITLGNSYLCVQAPGRKVWARLMDVEYPKFKDAIARVAFQTVGEFDRDALIDALTLAASVSTDVFTGIVMRMTANVGVTFSGVSDTGTADSSVDGVCALNGAIKFDPQFAIDALGKMEGMVTVGYADKVSPLKLTQGNVTAFCMPMCLPE